MLKGFEFGAQGLEVGSSGAVEPNRPRKSRDLGRDYG